MKDEDVNLFIGAFKDKATMLCSLGMIQGINEMDWDDVLHEIKKRFGLYVQYKFDNDNEVICRIMFIRKNEYKKTWLHFGSDGMIHPISFKYMTTVLEYDKLGEINEIYDE